MLPRSLAFVTARLFRRLVSAHIEGRTNHEKILWSLVNLELFLRAFKPSGVDDVELNRARVVAVS